MKKNTGTATQNSFLLVDICKDKQKCGPFGLKNRLVLKPNGRTMKILKVGNTLTISSNIFKIMNRNYNVDCSLYDFVVLGYKLYTHMHPYT